MTGNRENKTVERIYCIGDSHACFFSGKDIMLPVWSNSLFRRIVRNAIRFFSPSTHFPFVVYRLGPVLAYNLCKSGTTTRGREKLFKVLKNEIPKNSHVMFCFGEIDCRAHLLKQAEKQSLSVDEVVQTCVSRYGSVLKEVQELEYNPLIWNVIPSTILNRNQYHEFPTYGTFEQRNEVTRIFNHYLKIQAEKSNIPFISIGKNLLDEKGSMKLEYTNDQIHLNQNAMPLAIKALNDNLITKFVVN